MREFLQFMIPCIIAIAAILAFHAAGGEGTSTGRIFAIAVIFLGIVAMALFPVVLRRARRQEKAARDALEDDLVRRHRERRSMDTTEHL